MAYTEGKIYQVRVINSTVTLVYNEVTKSEGDTVQLLGLSLMSHILK